MQQQQQRTAQQQQQQPKVREAEAATKVQDEFESMRSAVMSGFNQQTRDLCNVANRERDAVTMERTAELLATKTKSCAQRLIELNATKENHKAASERMEAGLQQIAASKQKCQEALKASVAFRGEARKVLDVIAKANKAVDDPTAELGAELRRVKPLVHKHTFAEWQAFTQEAERVVATLNATTATMRTTATIPDGAAGYLREVLRGEDARPSPFFGDRPAADAATSADNASLFTADTSAALELVAQGATAAENDTAALFDEGALATCAHAMADAIKDLRAVGATVPKAFEGAASLPNVFTEVLELQRQYVVDAARLKALAAELEEITSAQAADDAALAELAATTADLERQIVATDETTSAAETKDTESAARLAAIGTETAAVQAAIATSELALKALNDEAARLASEVAALDAVSVEREAAFRVEQEALDAELAAAKAVQAELEDAIAKAAAEVAKSSADMATNKSAEEALVAAQTALVEWVEAHAENAADFAANDWNDKVDALKSPLRDAIDRAVAIHGESSGDADGGDDAIDAAEISGVATKLAAAFEVAVARRREAVAKLEASIARDEAAIVSMEAELQELGVTASG